MHEPINTTISSNASNGTLIIRGRGQHFANTKDKSNSLEDGTPNEFILSNEEIISKQTEIKKKKEKEKQLCKDDL